MSLDEYIKETKDFVKYKLNDMQEGAYEHYVVGIYANMLRVPKEECLPEIYNSALEETIVQNKKGFVKVPAWAKYVY